MEKSQKPSEIRMRFENLAKQNNEVKVKERPKPISIQVGIVWNNETNKIKKTTNMKK